MKDREKKLLWVEKYRPMTIDECILPDSIKKYFRKMVEDKDVQNMLLSGSHGIGKTTIAKALCNELEADMMFLNCSKERGIDDVRVKINNFASSMSLYGGIKVIICDEADYLTADAQAALRGVIENVSSNCRFVFTCNYPNKIFAPLKSRLLTVDFTFKPSLKPELAKQFMQRTAKILKDENVKFDKAALAGVIRKHFPDFRKVVQTCQHASTMGELDASFLQEGVSEYGPYISALKARDFRKARKWIGETAIDPADFFHTIDQQVTEIFDPKSYAQAIMILNEGQFKHAFAVDEDLSIAAVTLELMQCTFKK